MTAPAEKATPVSNWWRGEELAATVARVRPYTMVREGALLDLALQVRAVLVHGIPGDFVECGVWRGGAAFLMAECLRQAGVADRKVWLCDSYAGLRPPKEIDGRAAAEYAAHPNSPSYFGNSEASLEDVQRNAASLGLDDHLQFVQGWFDQTLPAHRASIGDIALLRLDCDWYESVKCCLENLYDNVAPHGFIVLDDYFTFDGAALAVHEFLGSRRLPHRLENVITFEDGYAGYRCALFRKGNATWNETREWLARIDEAVAEIETHISTESEFILVDQGELGSVHRSMTRGRPFVQRDDDDWGPPADGPAAIEELERRRAEGASALVFPWSTFWWLDQYPELHTHLRSRYRLAYDSPNVRMFDLR